MKFDKDENGGFLTTRDLWNICDHEPRIICVNKEVAVAARPVWLLHCSLFYGRSYPPITCSDKEAFCHRCPYRETCGREQYLTARKALEVDTSAVRTS